jgi:hypothetical protein
MVRGDGMRMNARSCADKTREGKYYKRHMASMRLLLRVGVPAHREIMVSVQLGGNEKEKEAEKSVRSERRKMQVVNTKVSV